ncbi:ATP-binding protein [Microbulbifer thermotolerans]|uniref:histidine kinase n=1 Tax=Microbulbifer thermotolerans TaxID=252514 RepID=A0AB35HVN9_MICTH|nr:ATP-binding protein [Microbulbifer thermotolerans]MCX2780882.1 ATP-binding protein [Microbulbifer thermotolerans]MCX2784264.1 ATP-binding protein [Microbulbifer thermotolerans]MCX2794341.1 ATP-binding protein [Microbulbifer thermotolerans]MCX2800989.1 ATP-binding protein [Microbulbifer thermotolerans]MCX2804847.1 ATP-binding protein [Microbulbifer thermotolerans]
MPKKLSLEGRIAAISLLAVAIGASIPIVLIQQGIDTPLAWTGGLLLALPTVLLLLRLVIGPISHSLKALEGGLLNFRDGDFSVSLVTRRNDQLGYLTKLYNEVAEILRRERAHIYQQELLLDTLIQSSPQALLLVDQGDHIIYSNSGARHLLNRGKPIQGLTVKRLLPHCPQELADAIEKKKEGLLSYSENGETRTLHLSNSSFVLNAQKHQLIVIREMTRELTRAEVQVWKKVIRLISHELNNSLAPISSMAHSGKLLIRQPGQSEALEKVFDIIADRCQHLTEFTQGYARFAKLPAPSREPVRWQQLVERLKPLHGFTLKGELPNRPGYFDPVQMEQALLNLFKNAAEAGSDALNTELQIKVDQHGQELVIRDRGHGMSEKVLQQALLPFYSTKPQGVGLGLTLCREIIDAHGGRIQLQNRAGGGIQINLWLPWPETQTAE